MSESLQSTDDISTSSIANRRIFLDHEIVEDCGFNDRSLLVVVDLLKINISVEAIDGTMVDLDVSKSNTVEHLKNTMKCKGRFNKENHRLKYQESILEYDYMPLGDYGIKDKSVIKVVPRIKNVIQIHANVSDKRRIDLKVRKEDRIIDIKKKIGLKIGRPEYVLELMHQGDILVDDNTVGSYNIDENAVINVKDTERDRRIFARVPNNCTIPVDLTETDQITDVKKKIQDKTGLSTDLQRIVHQGATLQDDKLITDYDIFQNTFVDILRDGIKVIINAMNGKKYPLEVPKHCKILEIKSKIQERIEISPDKQRLVHQGHILDDDRCVEDYNIMDDSVIVVVDMSSDFHIIVRAINGTSLSFPVTNSDKIIDIKKTIKEKIGLLEDDQIWEYHGQILENDKTISDYGISDNSIINNVSTARTHNQISLMMDDRTKTINVAKGSQISDIRTNISEIWHFNKNDEQVFIYKGEILDEHHTVDDKTVEHGRISENNIIDIVTVSRNIGITVNYESQKFVLNVMNLERIIDIKKKICNKFNLSIDEQIIKLNGNIIADDNARLYKCGVTDNMNLEVSLKSKDSIILQIFCASVGTRSLNVLAKDTIMDVKMKIEKKMGILHNNQRLEHVLLNGDCDNLDSAALSLMKQKIKGICVIINNETFLGRHPSRNGTDKDEKNISETFGRLNYEIKPYQNVKSYQMKDIIDKTKDTVDKAHSMLIVFILSHGNDGAIIFTDGEIKGYEDIWSPFTNKNFPKFAGKPKLFFFVCCHGAEDNAGIDVSCDLDGDQEIEYDGASLGEKTYPGMADIFLGFATCNSYKAGRHRNIGTYYVSYLCNVIRENTKRSVSDIHQEVQRLITMEPILGDGNYQMPYFTNLLTTHAYFND